MTPRNRMAGVGILGLQFGRFGALACRCVRDEPRSKPHGSARDHFVAQFVGLIGAVQGADLAFPQCFVDGKADPQKSGERAVAEWDSWIDGGYGVCLRTFTAETCITKEALGASLKLALTQESRDDDKLLLQAERLSSVMLPFAPWQRDQCTPGRTIDPLLASLNLGNKLPYGVYGEAA